MMHDPEDEPAPPCPARLPDFHLRYGPIFWRVLLVGFVFLEVVFWLKRVRPALPFQPRLPGVVLMAYVAPRFLFYAILIAAIVTVVTDLVFRLLVRPLMCGWYHPRSFDPSSAHTLAFRLGVGEEVVSELPARRVMGRRKVSGTLARTTRRVYFIPYLWDVEDWSIPFEHVAQARLITPPRRVLGWVSGYPDHVVVTEDSSEEVTLVVADPRSVLGWFGEAANEPDLLDEPVVSWTSSRSDW